MSRYLERVGLIEQDAEHTWLAEKAFTENVLEEYQSHSVSYRIATGPQKGRKVFSLHAGVSIRTSQREFHF